MRLLVVHNLPFWDHRSGGGQRISHEIAARAAHLGHDVMVVFLGDGGGPPSPLPYSAVHVREHRRLLVNAWRLSRAVASRARSWGADAVYASAPEAGFVPWFLPPGVGLVATLQHPDPPPLEPVRLFPDPVAAIRLVRRQQEHRLMASVLRGAHCVTVPSRWSREAMLGRGYLPPDSDVGVVRNGVSEAWFRVERSEAPETDLLFIGRLERQKGLDVLLRALALPSLAGVTLRVVGTGPDEKALASLATTLGLMGRVSFAGFQSHDALRGLAGRSRAFVFPSRHESFGMVLVEAMAAGLPCVAAAVGGVPEFAADAALLVPPEDPHLLAKRVAELLRRPDLAATLAAAGRQVAEAHRWGAVVDDLMVYVRRAVEAARGAADAGLTPPP